MVSSGILGNIPLVTSIALFKNELGSGASFAPQRLLGLLLGTELVVCKRSEFELFTQIFFYILLKCQSITAVCLDAPTAIEISLLDLSFIAFQRT